MGQCVTWSACFAPSLCWYQFILLGKQKLELLRGEEWPGLKPVTCWLQVTYPNYYATMQQLHIFKLHNFSCQFVFFHKFQTVHSKFLWLFHDFPRMGSFSRTLQVLKNANIKFQDWLYWQFCMCDDTVTMMTKKITTSTATFLWTINIGTWQLLSPDLSLLV